MFERVSVPYDLRQAELPALLLDRRCMLTGLAASLLPGCAPQERSSAAGIALVMKSLANAFFVNMAEGARRHEAAQQNRYRLLINGTRNESDLAQQVSIVDQMIAAGVQAIVIAPADSKAIVPAVARARRAGIVVVNIDNRMDRAVLNDYDVNIPFVGPDDRDAADRAGRVLADQLRPGDQVAILEGISTADNSKQRRAGLEAAARRAGLSIVTIQSANWDQAQAAALSSAIILQYPALKGIFCGNDNMALGAVSAIEQAGRIGQIRVTGFDNLEAVRPLVTQGVIVSTADQHGGSLAVYGIRYALEALGGARALPDRKTPVDIITAATLANPIRRSI